MILVIGQTKKSASSIAEIFYYMGILSFGTTPKDALKETDQPYRAILVYLPEEIPNIDIFVYSLRQYHKGIPVFALNRGGCTDTVADLFDECFEDNMYSSAIAVKITEYTRKRDLSSPGIYALTGIDASADRTVCTYFDKEIPFTKTQAMILRYLICSYPHPSKPRDILKFAFKSGRQPEPAAVRTHISVMNKKFRELFGNNLTASLDGCGYTLLTPEIMEKITV